MTNNDDVIDSRDVIARIELENYSNSDKEELEILKNLAKEGENSPDWEHGEILIHEDYFEQYMDKIVDECYEIPELPSFITIKLDYTALKLDYMEIDFNGQVYLIRS